mmetsp:Transcript_32478/g.87203  ORF Transcript_32478/g.87203 Transcript_32478/m.87203 type:complete len:240 (+) Transcript_32478:728-1447(+)
MSNDHECASLFRGTHGTGARPRNQTTPCVEACWSAGGEASCWARQARFGTETWRRFECGNSARSDQPWHHWAAVVSSETASSHEILALSFSRAASKNSNYGVPKELYPCPRQRISTPRTALRCLVGQGTYQRPARPALAPMRRTTTRRFEELPRRSRTPYDEACQPRGDTLGAPCAPPTTPCGVAAARRPSGPGGCSIPPGTSSACLADTQGTPALQAVPRPSRAETGTKTPAETKTPN